MLDKIEIDSFKIRLPFEQVTIIDESISGNWFLVNEVTGIYDEAEFKKNSLSFNIDGIKTKFAIEKQVTGKKTVETFVIILINSKVLQKKYFQGITSYNLKSVYKYLISLKVIDFSFDTFLQSEITDVDFKRDRIQKNFKESLQQLYDLSKLRKDKGQGCRKFIKKNNLGIEYSDRRTTSINTAPFLKIYSKEIELKKGSKDSQSFYGKYLNILGNINNIITDRIRLEFTIKNKKHFRLFGIQDTSLKNISSLPQKIKKEMMIEILRKHLNIENDFKIKERQRELKNIYKIILSFISILLNRDIPLQIIVETVIKRIETKQYRYYWKKKIYELAKDNLLIPEKINELQKGNTEFFRWLFDETIIFQKNANLH